MKCFDFFSQFFFVPQKSIEHIPVSILDSGTPVRCFGQPYTPTIPPWWTLSVFRLVSPAPSAQRRSIGSSCGSRASGSVGPGPWGGRRRYRGIPRIPENRGSRTTLRAPQRGKECPDRPENHCNLIFSKFYLFEIPTKNL